MRRQELALTLIRFLVRHPRIGDAVFRRDPWGNIFGSATAGGNLGDGIDVLGGDGNAIGGPAPMDGNLMAAGYLVIRFHHTTNWEEIFDQYSDIFGRRTPIQATT